MTQTTLPQTVAVIDSAVDCPPLQIIDGSGMAKAVIWPRMGALYRSFHMIDLEPGARTIDLRHDGESAYYVVSGSGLVVDTASGTVQAVIEGSVVHIGRGDGYRFESKAGSRLSIVGGPCPADESLFAHLSTK